MARFNDLATIFMYEGRTFLSKGKSKYDKLKPDKKDKFITFIGCSELKYYSEENKTVGFIEKTKQMTPISGKVKDVHKHVPEVQDILPNIFKSFIRFPEFRECYKSSRKQENYKEEIISQVKEYIPRENIHEHYIFEEITGKELTNHMYDLLSRVFKLVNYDVFNTGVREELKEFTYTLLKCKGVYTRIALVDSFNAMRNDQFLHRIPDSLSHRERTEMYVSEVLRRYTTEATALYEQCVMFYEKLAREMLYILWLKVMQDNKEVYDIKKLCDYYIVHACKNKQLKKEVGNRNLHELIQKMVMQGVMQSKLLI